MQIFRALHEIPSDFGPTVVSIGNFDGVHRGHQWLLNEIQRSATAIDAKSVAVTFDPHPSRFLRSRDTLKLITPMPERLELLAASGIDATAAVLETIFAYTFSEESQYKLRARVQLNRLNGEEAIDLCGATFQRIPLQHGNLETGGYRFGNAAYLTDMNAIPDSSLPLLAGLEVVIIDALRIRKHPSHANIEEAIGWAQKIGAKRAWFTHMSHEILHEEVEATLPTNIRLAYDGLTIPFEL
jgi:phosphoribosyl 1,2-cyclic phosphate phosphodiesterase